MGSKFICDVHHATTETLHSTALPSRCTPAGVLPNMLSGGHVVLACSDSASNASPQSKLSRHDASPASAGEGPSVKGFRLQASSDLCLKYCFIMQAELNTRVAAIKEAAAQRSFAAAPVITINVHVHVIADSARSTPCTLAVAELARRPDQAARHFLVARCIRTLPRPLPLVALLHFQAPSPDSAGQ